MLTKAALFEQKYCEHINTVKYYFNLKLFSFVIY